MVFLNMIPKLSDFRNKESLFGITAWMFLFVVVVVAVDETINFKS